jgi:hypothetical protein
MSGAVMIRRKKERKRMEVEQQEMLLPLSELACKWKWVQDLRLRAFCSADF